MRRFAISAVLLLTTLSARAQCTAASDVAVASRHYDPAGGYAVSAVAANATASLGMWRQTHAGFGTISAIVDGMPMDAAGTPVRGDQLSFPGGGQNAIATDGTNFLVATEDRGYTWVSIADADGTRRANTTTITNGNASTFAPWGSIDAVWNGRSYVLFATVVSGQQSPFQTHALIAEVSSDGQLIGSVAFAEGTSALALTRAEDGRVLALWRDSNGVLAAFFNGTTQFGSAVSFPAISSTALVSIAPSTYGYVLAWRDSTVIVQRLDAHAQPVGPAAAFDAPATTTTAVIEAVAENPGALVLWNTPSAARAVRYDANGFASAPFTAADEELSSAAGGPNGTVILTLTACGSVRSSYLAAGASRASEPRTVSAVSNGGGMPSLASTRTGQQVTWSESIVTGAPCGTQTRLTSTFFGNDGSRRTTQQMNSSAASADGSVAAAAGDSSFVVFAEYPNGRLPGVLRVAHFDGEGKLVSNDVLAHGHFFFAVGAASTSDRVLVYWEQERDTMSTMDAWAAMISASGEVVVPPLLLSDGRDLVRLVGATSTSKSLLSWVDSANEIVTLELDEHLRITRRTAIPWTQDIGPFTAAGVNGDHAVLFADIYDGRVSLTTAIDPFTGRTATLPRPERATIAASPQPEGDGWAVLLAEGDLTSTVERLHLDASLVFGPPNTVFCVPAIPGNFALGISDGTILAAAYRPNVAIGETSILLRRVGPQRQRAVRPR